MNIILYIAAVWFGGVLLAGGLLGVFVRGGVFRLVTELVPVSDADAARVAFRAIVGIALWPYHIAAALLAVRPFVTGDTIKDMARDLSRFQPVNLPPEEGVATTEPQPRFEFEDPPDCTDECWNRKQDWQARYIAAFEKWEAERRDEAGAEFEAR